MTKEELISYLEEYLEKIKIAREKSLDYILGDAYQLERNLSETKDNPSKIVDIDLELLKKQLNISDDIFLKLQAYKFFAMSKYFELTEEQKQFIKNELLSLLDKILEKNDNKIALYPEISELDDEEYEVRRVLEKLLSSYNDITLEEYSDMVKILRTKGNLYAKDLLKRLSDYMNRAIIMQKKNQYNENNSFQR